MEFLTAIDKANRAAVLLAVQRYDLQIKPFVKGSYARFSFVEGRGDLDRIITEVCDEVGADPAYVESRFREVVARPSAPSLSDFDPIADADPAEKTTLEYKTQGDGLPPEGKGRQGEDVPDVEKTDVLDNDAVLDEHEPSGRLDLDDHTQRGFSGESSWKKVDKDFLV